MDGIRDDLEHDHPSSISDQSLHVTSSYQSLVEVIGSGSMLTSERNGISRQQVGSSVSERQIRISGQTIHPVSADEDASIWDDLGYLLRSQRQKIISRGDDMPILS